jgi:hypothetical protein
MSGTPRSLSASCAPRDATSHRASSGLMKPLAACTAALTMLCLCAPAAAQVRELAQAGGWSAYGGTSSDGRQVCGMSVSGGGRWIGIKYFEGDSNVAIQLSKSTWTVRDGLKVKVTMQFDDLSPWTARAISFHMEDGDGALQLNISSDDIGQFAQEFVRSDTLYVRFPDQDDIEDWQADLDGTPTVTRAWVRCLKHMQRVGEQFPWA